ncbi:MAG: transposase [Gammaproteobacteria bacterium]
MLARNARFESNSEALRTLQLVLFNEAEQDQSDVKAETADVCAETVTIPTHQRKRGGRKPLPEDLPRIQVIHDLSDEDKICPHDGHELKFISDKASEQLDIVPMKIQVIRHIRKNV